MSESDLDKGLQDLLAETGKGGAAKGSDPAPDVEDFTLDDDLTSLMAKPAAAGAARPGKAKALAAVASSVPVQGGPNLEFLLDIKLNVTFEVGRAKMLISDLLTLGQGSVIELHRLVGDELDLLVNGRLVAKGEVVVINEKFGCKITDIISPLERVKHMGGL